MLVLGCAMVLLPLVAQAQVGSSAQSERPVTQPRPEFEAEVQELFFPDALEAVGPGEPGIIRRAPSVPEPAKTPSTAEEFRWSTLVSRNTLEDEIKGLGPALAQATASAGQFKSRGYRTARDEFSLLAVLFGVIAQHDDEVRWQADAAGLREAYSRAAASARVGRDDSFTEAQARARDLQDLIRGSSVTVASAEATLPDGWHKIIDRPPLMTRMEVGLRERIGPWVAQESEFATQQRKLLHEAQLLAVLTQVIQDHGFEYADDEGYQAYVTELQQQCQKLIEAIDQEQFEAAQQAATKMGQACDDCHGDFRG